MNVITEGELHLLFARAWEDQEIQRLRLVNAEMVEHLLQINIGEVK